METVNATTTLLGDSTQVPPRRRVVPSLCEAGVVVRVLVFAELIALAGAALTSTDVASWLLHSALAGAIVAPATLIWLFATCRATAWLERIPGWARPVAAAVVGGLAATASRLLPLVAGIGAAEMSGAWSMAGAGALMGAAVYHWLELRLRTRLPLATEAGLMELQARVRPHFLFNTLNTAIALVQVDPERAEQVLEDLAELFRAALGALGDESTLAEEIRLARLYLAIEGMRFGKRLEVQWDIDESVLAARVPSLLLQPLVENAVRHGVEPNPAGGRVQIRARQRQKRAWVQVTNTLGHVTAHPGHGIGLASARERLRLMHDLNADFDAGPTDDHRYRVRLSVPL